MKMKKTIIYGEWSRDSVSFLDTTVKIVDGQIVTDLYVKPTDTHQYLATNSCHPRHCKEAIPYSQALRMRRICSSDEAFNKRTTDLKEHLTPRSYEETTVQQQIERAKHLRQEDALRPPAEKATNKRTPLVVSYHPNLPHLTALTKEKLPILHASNHLKQAIPELPIVAYRRPKNLRDLLVSAELKTPDSCQAQGSSPCGHPRCRTCQHIWTEDTFVSTTTGCSYHVRATATCKTRNVIYLIQCRKCKLQYVGETQNPLHIRLNGHRSDIRNKKLEKPVAAHFNTPGHSINNLSIMVIERMKNEDPDLRKKRESYWIHHLQSLSLTGMNLDP